MKILTLHCSLLINFLILSLQHISLIDFALYFLLLPTSSFLCVYFSSLVVNYNHGFWVSLLVNNSFSCSSFLSNAQMLLSFMFFHLLLFIIILAKKMSANKTHMFPTHRQICPLSYIQYLHPKFIAHALLFISVSR